MPSAATSLRPLRAANISPVLPEELSAASGELISTCREGNVKNAKKALKEGADIEAKDNYGRTALMGAARNGRKDCVKLLRDANANINANV